jgi:hypothetical protein
MGLLVASAKLVAARHIWAQTIAPNVTLTTRYRRTDLLLVALRLTIKRVALAITNGITND